MQHIPQGFLDIVEADKALKDLRQLPVVPFETFRQMYRDRRSLTTWAKRVLKRNSDDKTPPTAGSIAA